MPVVIYPAPRWFREIVYAWLERGPGASTHVRIDELFTELVRAQPPHLHVVAERKGARDE